MLANFHGARGGHTPGLSSTEVLPQNVAAVQHRLTLRTVQMLMTPVGFELTQLALVELESTPLDHSGKVSLRPQLQIKDYDMDHACQFSWSLWRTHTRAFVYGSAFPRRRGSAAQAYPQDGANAHDTCGI